MMNVFQIIVLAPIFIILLVVIFHTVWSAFDFGEIGSFVVSVCVSMLAIIGMSHFLKGSMEVILLPYAAMAIAILLITLFSFIGKHFKEAEGHCLNRTIKEGGSNYADEQKKKVEANPKKLKECFITKDKSVRIITEKGKNHIENTSLLPK